LIEDNSKFSGTCVIEASQGFLFDGSFNHAGARINYRGSKEASLLLRLEALFKSINEKPSPESREKLFDELCKIPHLDKLCRFHCTVLPRGVPISSKTDYVGRKGCPVIPEL
jgi:hypothetical protein